MDRYQPTNEGIWSGRIDSMSDPDEFRMHQIVQLVNVREHAQLEKGFSLLGYACDEGVKRNKGRLGAVAGPKSFRKAFSNMASHHQASLLDLGDVHCEDGEMEDTQATFAEIVEWALDRSQKVIGIGGGHDMAYAHFKGIWNHLTKSNPSPKIGIINLDAHFDLREPSPQKSSGTPFWQISREHPDQFHYCCIGIHAYANTKRLFMEAESLNVEVVERQEVHLERIRETINSFLDKVDYVYFTIDLDGMDAAICPGVSAPSADGLTMKEVLPILELVGKSGKLTSMDIAELNPTYDLQSRTAKVAAYMAYCMLSSWS